MGCGCGSTQKKTSIYSSYSSQQPNSNGCYSNNDPCLSTRLHPQDNTQLIQVICPSYNSNPDNNNVNNSGGNSSQTNNNTPPLGGTGNSYNPNDYQ